MKCTNRFITVLGILFCFSGVLCGCQTEREIPVTEYLLTNYNAPLERGALISEELCVSQEDISLVKYADDTNVNSAALFDVSNKQVLYSYSAHDRVYPASITKIMTALLALENGDLSSEVTISKNAAASSFSIYAQVCGLEEGDIWTLNDLLNALLLYSGNDTAVAIAEHIAGSEEAFVQIMNERAESLMAYNTHFCNPHGLHEEDHYTTAYDIYLIFQECIKNETFVNIINQDECTVSFIRNGVTQEASFKATNWYAQGIVSSPENVEILGGKTGTTDEGGYCLVLLERDELKKNYISIVMGAPVKADLYTDMTALIESIHTVDSVAVSFSQE